MRILNLSIYMSFIFNNFVQTKRFFVHYLSLILLLTYCIIFYVVDSFFLYCENFFDDSYMICIALYMWDAIVHQALPNLIIVVFSIALLARILYQKHRIHWAIQWRKYRTMIVQLLSISILYLIFAFPLTLMNLMYLCDFPDDAAGNFYEYSLWS
jgi:hypothetical protein